MSVKLVDPTTTTQEAAVTSNNALKVDISAVAAALADATANPTTSLVGGLNHTFNGTTWDRQRSVVNAQDTTGTGIAAAGILGQLDDASTGTVTENQFAPVRISSRRALLVEGVASGTNLNVNLAASAATVTVDSELPTAAALADATANPTTTSVGALLMGFNGTTWDRVRTTGTGVLSVDTELAAAAALADNTANPTVTSVGDMLHVFDGTTWDRARSTDATDGNTALTTTGLLVAGVGPGFSRRLNPSNLATASNSTSAIDVNGAGAIGIQVGTTTTGTFTIEVTADNTNWVAAPAIKTSDGSSVQGTNITPTTGDIFTAGTSGFRQLRLRTVSTLGATMAHTFTSSLDGTLPKVASGSTVDTELPAAAALADGASNPTTPTVGSAGLVFNGTTWDRARGAATLADALANPGTGLAQGQNFLMGFNGTTWDRVRTANTGRLQVDVVTGGGSNTPTGPTLSYQTSAAVAAGSTGTLTTAEAAGNKLWAVVVWASVPFKAAVQTVDNGSASANKALGGGAAYSPWSWNTPHPNFITLGTTAGLDAFQVVVTNLDNNTAADVYATFYYAT